MVGPPLPPGYTGSTAQEDEDGDDEEEEEDEGDDDDDVSCFSTTAVVLTFDFAGDCLFLSSTLVETLVHIKAITIASF